MIKIFASVMALLAVQDGFKANDEGNITLTQDQMKKIDDQLSTLNKTVADDQTAMKAADEKLKTLDSEKKALEDKVKKLEEQIANLQQSPADDGEGNAPVNKADETFTASDLFNSIKNV